MKIILVHNTYQQPGGEDAAFRNEYNLLTKAGHEVVRYVRRNHDVSHYVSVRQLALAKRTIWASDTREEFRQLLLRERPEIVHVHNTFLMVSPSVYWACRDANVPVIQTLHNYRLICPGGTLFRDGRVCEECVEHGVWQSVRYGCYRKSRTYSAIVAAMLTTHRLLGTWSRMIDYYLALTDFARRKFIAGGLPADKILVKPNFVYPDPGDGNGERSYALFVGRLSPEKGLPTLLAAWARLGIFMPLHIDRKSTRLNSSHGYISYAVFCLKKKKNIYMRLISWHTGTQLQVYRQLSVKDSDIRCIYTLSDSIHSV